LGLVPIDRLWNLGPNAADESCGYMQAEFTSLRFNFNLSRTHQAHEAANFGLPLYCVETCGDTMAFCAGTGRAEAANRHSFRPQLPCCLSYIVTYL
jgi:hypothetical protein